MWTAALALVQPLWTIIKPFWKYIAIAATLIVLGVMIRNWYEGKLDAAYDRGVAVTRAEDEKLAAELKVFTDHVVGVLKTSAAVREAELKGTINETNLIATNLRRELRASRVCTDEASGRGVSGDPASAVKSDGGAVSEGSAEANLSDLIPTVGDDLVAIGEQCQINTDKLLTLQADRRQLDEQLKALRERSLRGR